MTPYASFLYFAFAGLYVLAPAAALRVSLRRPPVWLLRAGLLAATALMLGVQYSSLLVAGDGPASQLGRIAAFAVGQYALALGWRRVRARTKARWLAWVAVTLALAPLAAAKLLAAAPGGADGGMVEFLGLSYATLRAIDVLVGIQDGLIATLPAAQYFTFLVFFPTVSAGPIDRWRRFAADWQRAPERADFWRDLDGAVHRIFVGFGYKFVLAYLIKERWLDRVPASPTLGHTLSYMYAYSAYLFFDFAGYSAFAVGFSHLLGVRAPENFDRPFLARNIKEFWTRWHITLSFWFRDFVYMRFLLAAIRGGWFWGHKRAAAYAANFLTFGLMGLWHGTARCYLLYGLYHACLLTGYDCFARWNRPHPDLPARCWGEAPWQRWAAVGLTGQAVCFGFLIFSGRRLF